MSERVAKPHEFWLETCGIDTHWRSPNHARLDTPWNAFTKTKDALVCTLWMDQIVAVFDPEVGHDRRFIKLGGRSREWKGGAVARGEEALRNLEKAVASRLPVFGFEAEPLHGPRDKGGRTIKHFYLDRAYQLQGWIGIRRADLEDRLKIDEAFERHGIRSNPDLRTRATLFELVAPTASIPGVRSAKAIQVRGGGGDDDEDDSGDQGAVGNLSADEYARVALPILVAHVLNQKDGVLVPITYLALAQLLGRKNKHGEFWARGLGQVLGRVTGLVEAASSQLPEQPPFLTSIVVLSSGPNAGLPDKGVSGRWPGYEALPRADKQARVSAEYQRVLTYGSRWNEILREAGLPPIALPPPSGPSTTGGWAGGESLAHKALKRFVLEHPELCGANASWFAQEEYALRSGDELDVMFKSDKLWIGVEVKSRTSDQLLSDYERGLYQVVKYKAVLEAQARVDRPGNPPSVRVLLALETQLPKVYRELADALGVQCLEGLSPTRTTA